MSQSRLLNILHSASPAHNILRLPPADMGLANDREPFPFLAIVGQEEMKLALVLAVINPYIGGVLLLGSRGTAKSTAVRALPDLLPTVSRSLCPDGRGCTEEMVIASGMEAVCHACATRFGYGQPLTAVEQVRLVELPLNARLADVVGSLNERVALEQQRVRLNPGILAQADANILYIDEVNLLDSAVMDAILDAAAQGAYTVRRGPLNLTYRARFVLIGSMNPEEGELRPQLMDRFGLRVVARGLPNSSDRYQAYERAVWYRQDPAELAAAYAEHTLALAAEIEQARSLLPRVQVSQAARESGLRLIESLHIDSNRAEITLFEAARAYAAAAEREFVQPPDVRAVALLALRLRQSPLSSAFFDNQAAEDARLQAKLASLEEANDLPAASTAASGSTL